MTWTHNICDDCWIERCKERNEIGRVPVRVKNREGLTCCYCTNKHTSGIFVRDNPVAMVCFHPAEDE